MWRFVRADGQNITLPSNISGEIERLRLQAEIWEQATEVMLDRIGVQAGWSCIDVGCGPVGILKPLSCRVGSSGRVVGIDIDKYLLRAASIYVKNESLLNVELLEGDFGDGRLSQKTFDLVHERFVLLHLESPETFLQRMVTLARPAGIVAVQEVDLRSMTFCPPSSKWPRLRQIIEETFALYGDINVGQRVHVMLRRAGLESVTVHAVVQALQNDHPYVRWPISGISAMRERIITARIATDSELDDLLADVEQHVSDPETYQISFTLVQSWGRKRPPCD